MEIQGLVLLLALSGNAGILQKASHYGLEQPYFSQQTATIYFPCHGTESPQPVGMWTQVNSMEEVYVILGMFYKETTLEDAKTWAAVSPDVDPETRVRLLTDGIPGSLSVLYSWCVEPYLAENST